MDRLLIKDYRHKDAIRISKTNDILFLILKNEDFHNDEINIELEKDVKTNILIENLTFNKRINLTLKAHSEIEIKAVLKDNINTFNLKANLENNASFVAYFADFSTGNNKIKVDINLNGDNSKAVWHLASLSAKDDNKEFDISLYHNGLNTYGLSDNYGVSKDDARLVFSGVSLIKNGSKNSKTRQNAKIMVFDDLSKAIAKPILKIDENEIEASHGASVGKINDEHMFYLTSRGLTEETAKELITMGYLKPILNGFEEEEIKEEISSLIEGRM